jgi:hypothetical protein
MITEEERQAPEETRSERRRRMRAERGGRKWVGGVALIVIGAVLLLATMTNLGLLGELVLPVLGIVFLVWGIMTSHEGPMIPGGILTGLGVGVLLAREVFTLSNMDEAGLITLCLGLGFLLILPFTAFFTPRRHWWPTIPGSILVVVGIALFIGDSAPQVLDVLGRIWPVGLIIAGVVLLWQVLRRKGSDA